MPKVDFGEGRKESEEKPNVNDSDVFCFRVPFKSSFTTQINGWKFHLLQKVSHIFTAMCVLRSHRICFSIKTISICIITAISSPNWCFLVLHFWHNFRSNSYHGWKKMCISLKGSTLPKFLTYGSSSKAKLPPNTKIFLEMASQLPNFFQHDYYQFL